MRNKDRQNRRSLRLANYDYSLPGAYFITICSHKREPLFGNIRAGTMTVNRYGDIVKEECFAPWSCAMES